MVLALRKSYCAGIKKRIKAGATLAERRGRPRPALSDRPRPALSDALPGRPRPALSDALPGLGGVCVRGVWWSGVQSLVAEGRSPNGRSSESGCRGKQGVPVSGVQSLVAEGRKEYLWVSGMDWGTRSLV